MKKHKDALSNTTFKTLHANKYHKKSGLYINYISDRYETKPDGWRKKK